MDDFVVGFVCGAILLFLINIIAPTTSIDADEFKRAVAVCEPNGGLKYAAPDGYFFPTGVIVCQNGARFRHEEND